MKINREEFVELLVQRTGWKKERVEEQLTQLISEIHETTSEGERYTVPRLGSFVTVRGRLQFVPAESLRIEVNHKYAGMQPIELISTYEKSEEEKLPAVPPEDDADSEASDKPMIMRQEQVDEDIWPDEEDIWGWDGDESPEEETTESQSAAADNEKLPPAEEEKKTISADEPEGEDEEPEPEESEEPEERAGEGDGSKEQAPALVSEPAVESPLAEKKEKLRHGKKKTSSLPLILVAAAMVILIAVSSWFLYDMGVPANQDAPEGPAAEETAGQTQDQATRPSQHSEAAESTQNDPPAGESSRDAGGQNSEPSGQKTVADNESGAEKSVYGLKGHLNSEANDGYTIVIFSMKDRQRAKEMYNAMNQKGYRTLMVPAIVDGDKFWRVAVGQFETIPDAQKNARLLPKPYNNNFFIKSIL